MRDFLPFLLLVGLALLFRYPFLINPERMDSDHAFLGLQALRILKGEWSWFLWRSEYQASWEPFLGSLFFTVLGPSFSTLQWVPLSGFLLCLWLMYSVLKRYLGVGPTLALLLLWVFATRPFVAVNVLPYRQWSIVFMLLAIWCAERAGQGHRQARLQIGLAGFFPFFSLFVDFFAIQFFLPVLLFAYWQVRQKSLWKPFLLGFLVGGTILALSRLGVDKGAPLAFSIKTMLSNIPLFFKLCFPVFMGVPIPADSTVKVLPFDHWTHTLLLWVGVLFLGFQLWGAFRALRDPSLPLPVKRLGILGGLITLNALLGFWGSSMASDVHSVRYLQPLLYAAPLALLPLVLRASRLSFATPLTLYLLCVGWAGWNQFYPLVQKGIPVRDPGAWVETAEEMKAWMHQQGVNAGYSDYWVSYQLSFLYLEDPIIVARHAPLDRYAIYRKHVQSESRVAEVFTPSDSPQFLAEMESEYKRTGQLESRWEKNGFTVLIRAQSTGETQLVSH